MSYRLEDGEPLAAGVRRVAREEILAAARALREETAVPDAVHDARERLKKVRAVLRLVRDEIGDRRFTEDNAFYRDRGRELAEVRDAWVAVDTLEAIRARFTPPLAPHAFGDLHAALVERSEAAARLRVDEERRPARVADALEASLDRVEAWPIGADRFDTIAPGLRRVYRRGRRAFGHAYEDPTFERFHEWRKRAKYLWYHARLLEGVWPDVMGGLQDSIHAVSDLVGESNDLSELARLLRRAPSPASPGPERDALLALIETRRAELRGRARLRGVRIWAETPDAFIERIRTYWEAWRDEPSAPGIARSDDESAAAEPHDSRPADGAAYEIERKFVVRGWPQGPSVEIRQGYLTVGEREVRVRLTDDEATVTVKARDPGPATNSPDAALVRAEVEVPVDPTLAEHLLELCPWSLRKTRYRAGRWEIDVFENGDDELILAEVELDRADAPLPERPAWLRIVREVTDDPAYLNRSLARRRGDEP